jgi:hypothetical protein
MKKSLLFLVGIAVIGITVYATGAYTYFQKRIISEELPIVALESKSDISEERIPEVVKSGWFVGSDLLHTGTGTAKIIAYPDGSHILRFEDFSVVNGPDVYVYLSNTTTPSDDIGSLGDYIDLGELKGNIGNQNYTLPQGAEDYQTVVLWCKEFGVLFPYAVMSMQRE